MGYKLTYLGLPAEGAHDVISWIDYIDYVIAFQCRNYPEPSSIEQSKDVIIKLEEKLLELERQGKISSFSLYDGYIEEVLIKGKDTSGQEYIQDRTVTVYNLDFCNSIIDPIYYHDENNIEHKAFKSQAIRKLLQLQSANCQGEQSCKFVMFLTVHSNFFGNEEKRFLNDPRERDLQRYLNKISRNSDLSRIEKMIRRLKAYIYQLAKNFFCTSDFSPEFLPVIFYEGTGENWLTHFTIVGAYNKNPSSIATIFQNSAAFLNQKFLYIDQHNKLYSLNSPGISENNAYNNSVRAFKNSQIFQRLWQ
ncbi:MAG: hypothetical protein QQN41_09510 [Nitrosopumilus sp.]